MNRRNISRRIHIIETEGDFKTKPSMIESSMLNKLITFDLLSIIPNERDFRIISGSEYFKDYDNSIFITLKPNSFVNLNYVNKGKVEYIALYCKDFYLKIDLDSTNIMR